MANLIDFSTLKSKVDNFNKIYNLEKSALAFIYVTLESILDLPTDEMEDAITEGSDDRGIDALYIEDNFDSVKIHIFQCKYTEQFEKTKNRFPSNEIDKLITIIQDILNKKEGLKKEVNSILWDKIESIWKILENKRPKFYVYLCNNALPPVETQCKRLEDALKVYRDFEAFYYDLDKMVKRFIERKRKIIDRNIKFIGKQYFEKSDGNVRGVIATIDAPTLIDMVRDPEDKTKILDDILNDNVRIYLKSTNPINKGIIESALSDDNYEFWYLNNGITLTCEKINYTPNSLSPFVELKNIQVVNGGQTTNAIFEAYKKNEDKVKDLQVLVRIYETTKDTISQKITETTNSQTPVRSRDLRANSIIMKKLEEEFMDMGYYFERKKNFYQDKPSSKRIDAEQAAQAFMAFYLEAPAPAKSKKATIFAERFEDVFNDEISAIKLLIPFLLLKEIETHKKELQINIRREEKYNPGDIFLLHASFHLLTAIKYLAESKGLDFTWENLDKLIRLYAEAKKVVKTVVKEEEKKQGYAHNNFFKDTKTIQKIADAI